MAGKITAAVSGESGGGNHGDQIGDGGGKNNGGGGSGNSNCEICCGNCVGGSNRGKRSTA